MIEYAWEVFKMKIRPPAT